MKEDFSMYKDKVDFKLVPEIKEKEEKIVEQLEKQLTKAIEKRASGKIGVLFSGGIDSTLIAMILKKLGHDFTCYTAALDDSNLKQPEDLIYAEKVAKELGFKLKVVKIKLGQVEEYLKKIIHIIKDPNVVKVGVALPIYFASEQAKKDGCRVVFSGLGSEEIFAGYQRHRETKNINQECLNGLKLMYKRDLTRDSAIAEHLGIDLMCPFLDKDLVEYSLRIPAKYKIRNGQQKHIIRQVGKKLGLKKEFAERKKRAAQYGSNFHKALIKLTKKNRFNYIKDYLATFFPLGALISSGKDSIYAMYKIMKQGYKINCLITLKSKNPDSFMFHTPTIDLVKLQAESVGIPLIEHKTKGEEEKELTDLTAALEKAKKQYNIQGITTGALFSSYQKNRIEKVCEKLNLKVFSPLWHMDQEKEIREIIDAGFKFIITKIAAEGLDKTWLGKVVGHKDVDKLVELNKKIGLNISGEGGEFETLMVDGPCFSKPIKIVNSEIEMENERTGNYNIIKAELE